MAISLSKDLSGIRDTAIREIDYQAGIARGKIITVSPGQDHIYSTKQREAEAVMANPDINPHEVPLLAGEVESTGETLFNIAATVLSASYNSAIALNAIEQLRRTAKDTIRAAKTEAEIIAAKSIDW